jgi:esterase/lipase
MKKFELLRINDSLIKAMNYKNHEFAYAVFKNKQLIEDFLSELDFFNNVPPKYVEYENRRVELCKQTCKKDENGMDIINNGRYEIQDQETFTKQMDAFHNEYKDEITIRDEQVEQLNLILQQDMTTPNFIKVKKGDLPIEIQTASELYEFSFMIE